MIGYTAHINWLATELIKAVTAAPQNLQLSILIYLTSGAPPSSDDSAAQTLDDGDSGMTQSSQKPQKDADVEREAEYDEKSPTDVSTESIEAVTDLKGVTTIPGRPDIRQILEDVVTTSDGPVSVDGEPIALASCS